MFNSNVFLLIIAAIICVSGQAAITQEAFSESCSNRKCNFPTVNLNGIEYSLASNLIEEDGSPGPTNNTGNGYCKRMNYGDYMEYSEIWLSDLFTRPLATIDFSGTVVTPLPPEDNEKYFIITAMVCAWRK